MTFNKKAAASNARFILVCSIIACGTALSAVGWWFARAQTLVADMSHFSQSADRFVTVLQERFHQTELALRSGQALFDASDRVERREWRAFANSILPTLGKNVVGIGYVERVPRARLPAFLEEMRKDSPSDFILRTSGDRPDLYIYRYFEPLQNDPVLGFDVATDDVRRAAADQAMLTGAPVMTRSIALVTDSDVPRERQLGFNLLIPVYTKGEPPTTPEARRARLQGWIAIPFRVDAIMSGLTAMARNEVDYELYEGRNQILPQTLLAKTDSVLIGPNYPIITKTTYHNGTFVKFRHVDGLFGQQWTLCLISRPEFDAEINHLISFPRIIFFGGLLISGLGACIVWVLGGARARAVKLAESMTADLRRATAEAQKLAHIASHISNAVIVTDAKGCVEWVNDSFLRLTGYVAEEARRCKVMELLVKTEGAGTKKAAIQQAIEKETEFKGEAVYHDKAGNARWADWEVQALRDEEKRVINYMV
ncbi:MAG: CHASE domain-containing protein, partial [Verrucomicrobiota bacterium]|nr:CHASE domain-containing protein [Verrucomicrobiota bacterium]